MELANERLDADGDRRDAGEHNYLEVFGIPPSLSVLAARVEEDVRARATKPASTRSIARALEQWTGDVIYLDRDRAQARLRAGGATTRPGSTSRSPR